MASTDDVGTKHTYDADDGTASTEPTGLLDAAEQAVTGFSAHVRVKAPAVPLPPAARFVAPRSPHIDPGDIANRTPQQIDDLANDAGLIPRGPDPQVGRGAYIDPVTGEQRILCHPGACPPHAHVNDPAGNRLDINGNIVSPESPAAHLPLSTDASP